MSRFSRVFRIFVSSTFSDFKPEREALQEHVFPKLRDLCQAHGCRFQGIDLRWGVAEEAALNQQTMNICLEELRRCQLMSPRPNFVILLGQRYGWRPLPPQVAAGEFEALSRCTAEAERLLLSRWYLRDDNVVPPHYRLQQRSGSYEDQEMWGDTECRLRAALAAAARAAGLTEEARVKYEASATHQEIHAGALRADDPTRQVFAFFRTVHDLPQDAAAHEFIDLDAAGAPDEEAQQCLSWLKEDLRHLIGANVTDYATHWTGNGIDPAYLEGFCSAVYERLAGVILQEVALLEKMDALDEEVAANERFALERARCFIGRADYLAQVEAYTDGSLPRPLVLHGRSGCGKSALMAKAALECRLRFPHYRLIVRFVGATPATTDIRSLLQSICRQIQRLYGRSESPLPSDYKELVESFKEHLALADAEHPLLLFLDALDQLSDVDRARNLIWLPMELPAHVRVVVSTLPGETLHNLEKRLGGESLLQLQPMAPSEGAQLLELWLEKASLRLQPPQRDAVLAAFGANGLPLYLKLAFEETKRWTSATRAPDFPLPPDIPGLIRLLFRRLSFEGNHGRVLVSRSLGYLAAARHGLTEDELMDVLSRDGRVLGDFQRRSPRSPAVARLPVIVWSRLYSELEPYLTYRQGNGVPLISFYHRQLAEEAGAAFLPGKTRQARHRALAEYFQCRWREQGERRALSELPFQQTRGELWRELEGTLTDLAFVEGKCVSGATYDLVADYNSASAAPGIPPEVASRVSEFGRFVKAQAHVLVRRPNLALQQAANEPSESAPARAARARLEAREGTPWLRWVNKPRQPSACLMVLVGHLGDINGCEVSPDGTRLVSAGWDRAIHVWDPATGTELLTMFGHDTPIATCAYSPDGSCVASGGYDGTLKLWDPVTGAELPPLAGHPNQIEYCTFSRDGTRLISAGNDNTLRIWEVASRRELAALSLGRVTAMACAFSPDGTRFVSGNQLGEVTLWDAQSFTALKTVKAHDAEVMGCFFSPDGKWCFTTSEDTTFKRWPAQLEDTPLVFRGHRSTVWACSLSTERGLVASVSGDKTINLWNAGTGGLLATLTGHTDAVLTCAFLSAGSRLVTSSWDGTIRIWDVSGIEADAGAHPAREAVRDLDKHLWMSCGFSADGEKLVAGSEDDLQVWDAGTGAVLGTFGPHSDYVRSAKFSPDGTWLLSSASSDLYRWEVSPPSGATLFRDHEALVSGCHISPDGAQILSSAEDGTLRLWEAKGGKGSVVVLRHATALTTSAAAPDWSWAAVGSKEGMVRLVSLPAGEALWEVRAHPGEVTTVAVSPDGRLLATGGIDGVAKVWDVAARAELRVVRGHTASIDDCAFSPDGSTLATISSDHTLKIWEAPDWHLQRTLVGHATAFQQFAYSPDGARIVSGSYDGTLRLWSTRCGAELAVIRGFQDQVVSGAFSPAGDRFVSASHYRALKVTDAETGQTLLHLAGHEAEVRCCAFSPDGKRIVSASADGTLRSWDAHTGKTVATLRGHRGPVHCCALSPDGALLASASWDRTLRLWDAHTGRNVRTLSGHADWVKCVSFSPDGGLIASCGLDGTVRLWSTSSGRMTATLAGHAGSVDLCSFSPHGGELLSASGDGTLKLWDVGTTRARLHLDGHGGAVRDCTFAPDAAWAASVSMDGKVRLWDLHSGDGTVLGEHDSWLHCCAWSPDGAWLASGGKDALVKVWDAAARTLRSEYWVGAAVRLLAWHPTQAKLVVGDEEGGIHFLECE